MNQALKSLTIEYKIRRPLEKNKKIKQKFGTCYKNIKKHLLKHNTLGILILIQINKVFSFRKLKIASAFNLHKEKRKKRIVTFKSEKAMLVYNEFLILNVDQVLAKIRIVIFRFVSN
ncbi:hypothetical protein BpHYR1_039378 [Brachionus plicatilis]|uniref:Uncharacterized protein n=1 Tax=Brachionus plicatilis TaxID=10195 RepID=A0A3M7SUY1_BRAPC|nr:hypothetical protein BpHYR1_039378 [Brachionus plicatilis]